MADLFLLEVIMKQFEMGRTLLETLAIIAIIGILSISGLNLYAKAMNTIRVNYIMQQIYIRANDGLNKSIAAQRRRPQMFDTTITESESRLAYGYSFGNEEVEENGDKFIIRINGPYSKGLCKILYKKMKKDEYPGLQNVFFDNYEFSKGCNSVGSNTGTIKFYVNKHFKKTKKGKKYAEAEYRAAKEEYQANPNDYHVKGVLQTNPLICDREHGWFEFDDAKGHCEQCPAGYFCE